ncbi:MAG TPA: DnaB-like helicase N-terminal domain-containing protein, partial [Bacteroidales bacterium]|nr:DnaB-like helicase N-terminal domain-containing protein [Bacteroidales bacterium]
MEKERVSEVKRENKISYNTIENTFGLTGKLTPQAVDFEEAILGALMIDKDAIAFIDFITDKMFYKEQHQLIFRVITDLFQNSHPIDLLTVTESLRKNKQLDFIGGPSYLASLTHRVASSANIEYHARVVMEKFVLRELIAISTATIKDAYDDSKDVLKLLDKAETDLFGIIQNNFKRESKQLDDIVKKALDELMELRNQDGNYQGVPSGIKAIDEKIGGWQKSDLIIVAARPGMGKTSFMLSVARNAAIDFKKPIALFSLEMSATQLVHRLFSMESGITSERIS